MTKILKSPARINRRSPHHEENNSGFSWSLADTAFDDPFESLEKKEIKKEKDRARDNKNKRRGL